MRCKLLKNIFSSSSKFFLLLLFFFNFILCKAQNNLKNKKNYTVEFQLFSNTNLLNQKGKHPDFNYNFKRTLIIYKQYLKNNFSFCLAGDSYAKKSEHPINRSLYIKRAYLNYKNKKISLSAGLLVLEQFKYQKKIWKLRYLDKTFQNKFKYGENRSLGILFVHKLNKNFSYDIALTNGYNTPSKDCHKNFKIMLGQSFFSNDWIIKLYNSISLNSDFEKVHSLFISKKLLNFNLGFEAAASFKNNYQNNQNTENKFGFSFFQNYSFNNHFMLFSRYDFNRNTKEKKNKTIIFSGFQYSLKKYLKASLYYKNEDFNKNFWGISIFIHFINT